MQNTTNSQYDTLNPDQTNEINLQNQISYSIQTIDNQNMKLVEFKKYFDIYFIFEKSKKRIEVKECENSVKNDKKLLICPETS